MASLGVKTRQSSAGEERSGIARTAGLALLLAASAYLMALSLRLEDARWLGWITLLPLFLSIRVLCPLESMLAGGFWGLMLAAFSSHGSDASLVPGFRSYALLTLVPALYAAVASRVTRQVGFHPLLLGLGWVGVELALQPLTVRNGLLAATQGDGLAIRAIGHLGGYLCVAFLVAYVNASLLEMLTVVCPVGSARRVFTAAAGFIETLSHQLRWVVLTHPTLQTSPRGPPATI